MGSRADTILILTQLCRKREGDAPLGSIHGARRHSSMGPVRRSGKASLKELRHAGGAGVK